MKLKKLNSSKKWLKKVDCFLDGHGKYSNNLVSYKIKRFQANFLWIPKKFVKIND